MSKIISFALVSIMSLQSVFAGGGMSSVTFGVGFDGRGRHADPFIQTHDRLGRGTADLHFRDRPNVTQRTTSGLDIPSRSSNAWRRAEETFTVQNRFAYSFGVHNIRGIEYHFAKSANTEILTLPARKWEISTYTGFGATTTFTHRTEAERLAMQSFHFEKTPLLWHFAREVIGDKWYNHAWTDTFLDILIPDGKLMYVSAPEWYTQEREERAYSAATNQLPTQEKSEGFLTESLWSVTHAAHAARFLHEPEARRAATAAYEYYAKTRDFVADFFVPGGIENCRRYSNNEISTGTFLQKITEDVRDDAIAAMLGSLIGAGTGGTSAALASGGTMAIPGAIIGAKEGAAIGIAISRAVKAGVRSSGRGASSQGRTENVERAERKINAKSDMISFRDQQCKTGKWKKIGIKEGRQTYKDEQTGKLLQEDNRHYNFEVYPKGGGKHEGVLEPFTETIDFSKADPTRSLKL